MYYYYGIKFLKTIVGMVSWDLLPQWEGIWTLWVILLLSLYLVIINLPKRSESGLVIGRTPFLPASSFSNCKKQLRRSRKATVSEFRGLGFWIQRFGLYSFGQFRVFGQL